MVLSYLQSAADGSRAKPRFISVTSLEDVQAIRTVAFHPEGNLFVIGANSKTLRICRFPAVADLRCSYASVTYQFCIVITQSLGCNMIISIDLA